MKIILTKNPFFGGVGGYREGGTCTCMNKCFKWHYYSSRTPVQNNFEIHAYMSLSRR